MSEQRPAARISSPRARILLVEPSRGLAGQLARALERLGYDVVAIADTGAQAIALATIERPALVVVDRWLDGELDGSWVARAIASQLGIPAVLVTSEREVAVDALSGGTVELFAIQEPLDPRELELVIAFALYRHAAEGDRRALAQQAQRHERDRDRSFCEVASGLVHDLNNLLTVIAAGCGAILRDAACGYPAHTAIAVMQGSAEHAARLTRQLLAICTRPCAQSAAAELARLVEAGRALAPDDPADSGPELTAPAPAPNGTVVVVEHDPAVREAIRDMLQGAGIDVIEARDGREALVSCLRYAEQIDLVLSAVAMPTMDGRELARVLPEAPLVYMADHAPEDVGIAPGDPGERATVLRRPFTDEQLLALVTHAVHARRGAARAAVGLAARGDHGIATPG